MDEHASDLTSIGCTWGVKNCTKQLNVIYIVLDKHFTAEQNRDQRGYELLSTDMQHVQKILRKLKQTQAIWMHTYNICNESISTYKIQ
jgi:metallophosphoesterase superfamily enzyme